MAKHRYSFARRIAVGGMAEVLLTLQQGIAGFEKLVVVKRILPQLRDDGRFVEMFLNEARLAASLRHPNIVEIYDVVRDHDEFFIVMEYLSGEDVRTIFKRARREDFAVPVGVACRMIADAASGLEYAHTAVGSNGEPLGIVHRDVGPTNLLVTYTGVTKLVDFGVAKANVHNIYTKPGTIKGKYGYSSPEQVQHQELDARSDVFSLAVVLWELLTGRRLFTGKTPAEVLQAVMEKRILPPSALNPRVPRELDEVLAGALHRDRDRRTQSAQDLLTQLDSVLGNLRLHVGTHQVGSWMKTVLSEFYDERREVEQEVIAGGSGVYAASTAELPAAFRTSTSAGTGNPGGSSFTSGVDFSRSSYVSAVQGTDYPGVVPPGYAVVRWRRLLWAVLAILFISLLGVSFMLGRWLPDRPHSDPMPTRGLSAPATVAFLLRVNPPGARVDVDGKRFDQLVGTDGVLIEVIPNGEVELSITKEGYQKTIRRVRSPDHGTLNVFVNLVREEPEGLPPDETSAGASAPPPETPRAETGRGEDAASSRKPPPRASRSPAKRRAAPAGLLRASASIITNPPGALIEVAGRRAGRSPIRDLRLEPNTSHHVTARMPGFRVWSGTIRLPPKAVRTYVVSLEPSSESAAGAVSAGGDGGSESPSASRVRVPRSRVGDASTGARLFGSRCQTCHEKNETPVVPGDKTARQWVSFFAYGKHQRYVPLRGSVTVSEMADIKAFLMKHAYDVESDVAAGIR